MLNNIPLRNRTVLDVKKIQNYFFECFESSVNRKGTGPIKLIHKRGPTIRYN